MICFFIPAEQNANRTQFEYINLAMISEHMFRNSILCRQPSSMKAAELRCVNPQFYDVKKPVVMYSESPRNPCNAEKWAPFSSVPVVFPFFTGFTGAVGMGRVVGKYCRERGHIPPFTGSSENHRLKIPLGRDMLVPRRVYILRAPFVMSSTSSLPNIMRWRFDKTFQTTFFQHNLYISTKLKEKHFPEIPQGGPKNQL